MKRKLYLSAFILSATVASAQHHHDHTKCITDELFQMEIQDDPTVLQRAAQFEADYQQFRLEMMNQKGKSGEKFIIPVVFHVFHAGGPENISKEQIEDQIRILNEDYNNVDLSNLRPEFWGVAATCEIEFRLASKDPNGNCTDGIVRVYTPETENGTNNIKYKSAWPTDRYFNVWVVKDINSAASTLGTILGYAQFPWSGSAQTDGVVVRHDNVGSIGTGANPSVGGPQYGRTMTHEAGHWLGLYHPFQDSCFGGDGVDDTPPVEAPSFGNCVYKNTCTNDFPDHNDMVENYMDYADGPCMSSFTIGQKLRMHTTLRNWRPRLYSNTNLIETGVADPYTPGVCGPQAYFYSRLPQTCSGSNIQFFNNSYNFSNSAGISYTWEFEGGTPATSNAANPPTITYSEAGSYDVRLIASQTIGGTTYTDTFTAEDYITVYPVAGVYGAGVVEDFEFPAFPINGWKVYSTSAVNFAQTSTGAGGINGQQAVFVRNSAIENGAKFYLESPSMDLSAISTPYVSFYYAFAQRRATGTVGTNDGLNVQTSADCGKTWLNRFTSAGNSLSTLGSGSPFVSVSFYPSGASQWKKVDVNLSAIPTNQRSNVKIRFEFISRGGNNLFIDNINLGFVASTSEFYTNEGNFNVYPNPTAGKANISMNVMEDNSQVRVEVLDLFGREVKVLNDGILGSGEHLFELDNTGLANGMYLVKLTINGESFTRKVMIAAN